jgi:hypothetical protein
MKRNIVKLSCLTLTLIIALNSIMILSAFAQARPRIYVDPALNEFSTDTTSVGATFTVAVKAADWVDPSVFSYQFTFQYDPTMLEATAAEIPDGHWLTPTIKPANLFVVDSGTIDTALGTVSFSATLLSPELGKTGGGTIATITLKILAFGTCELGFKEFIMVNPDAAEIVPKPPDPNAVYDVGPATFKFQPPAPFLSVSSFSWDNAMADGAERLFNVSVSINSLSADLHVVGIQFYLIFNESILDTKAEWALEGPFARQFGPPGEPTFFVAYVEPDRGVIVGDLQLPPYPGPIGWMNGTGLIATIQFNATSREAPIGCDLTLDQILLVDADMNEVEYGTPTNGRYDLTAGAPPWLSVDPKEVKLENEGDTFDLNVQIHDLVKEFRMVGVEFQVHYNTTVLETTAEDITEGEFMKGFATRAGTDTFFQAYVEDDYGLIGIIILPLPDGTWPLEVFPEGEGVLATLTFTAIYQLDNNDVVTELVLSDVLLANTEAKEIPVDLEKTAAEGTCVCTILKKVVPTPPAGPDRMIDLFTQYPNPYAGRGQNNASDAFGPQGQVEMYAYVTYRGEPVPNKPVAYQIRGPGGYEVIETKFSGSNGLSVLKFSIPASTDYFGVWNITGSVDIAGQVVSDLLFFRVGWLIEAVDITIEPDERLPAITSLQVLYKGKLYNLTSTLKVITMQSPNQCVQLTAGGVQLTPKILLAYSGLDELKQPLFTQYMPLAIDPILGDVAAQDEDEQRSAFVLNADGRSADYRIPEDGWLVPTEETSIRIPTSAFSGVATIYANVFTDFPWYQGVPYSDPSEGTKEVYIKSSIEPEISLAPRISSSQLSVTGNQGSILDLRNGTAANIDINIKDVMSDEKIVAIQFQLTFDPNLVEVVDVIQRDFVKQFAADPDDGTFFVSWNITAGVLVGILQLPPYPGPIGWMEGSGRLATITLRSTGEIGSCFLSLTQAFVVNSEAVPYDFETLQHGLVRVHL